METRVCSKCNTPKPIEDFRLRNRLTRRRQSYCNDCEKKMGRIGTNEIRNIKRQTPENTETNTDKEQGNMGGIISQRIHVWDPIKRVVRTMKLIHTFLNFIMWETKQTKSLT